MEKSSQDYMLPWVSLVHLGSWLPAQLSEYFSAQVGISLAEQDLLNQLQKANGQLKMVDLAGRIFLSKAGVTKMVNRLELIRLVKRERSAADRRVVYVSMTALGRKKLQKSWQLFEPWVKANLADHLSKKQLKDLGSALETLLRSHNRWQGQMQHLKGKEILKS